MGGGGLVAKCYRSLGAMYNPRRGKKENNFSCAPMKSYKHCLSDCLKFSYQALHAVDPLPNPVMALPLPHPSTLANGYCTTEQLNLPASLASATSRRPHHHQRARWQTVFLFPSSVLFPVTRIGEKSVVKVRVCNKDSRSHEVSLHA